MRSVRLSYPQGDTGKICVHVVDSDEEPIDLAPYTEITFTLKRSSQDSAVLFKGTLTGGDIAILSPSEDGVCEVTVAALSLMIGRPYYWTVQLTNALGDLFTPVFGTLYADSPSQR